MSTHSINFLQQNSASIVIHRLPFLSFYVQEISVPGVSLGETTQPTRFVDVPHPGDKLQFDPLTIQFIMDENLQAWREIHNWMEGLGFPKNHEQFKKLLTEYKKPDSPTGLPNDALTLLSELSYTPYKEGSNQFSDATIFITNSNHRTILLIELGGLVPTILQGFEMTTTNTGAEKVTSSATFRYHSIDITVPQ